jgi:hypothetical protein
MFGVRSVSGVMTCPAAALWPLPAVAATAIATIASTAIATRRRGVTLVRWFLKMIPFHPLIPKEPDDPAPPGEDLEREKGQLQGVCKTSLQLMAS